MGDNFLQPLTLDFFWNILPKIYTLFFPQSLFPSIYMPSPCLKEMLVCISFYSIKKDYN